LSFEILTTQQKFEKIESTKLDKLIILWYKEFIFWSILPEDD